MTQEVKSDRQFMGFDIDIPSLWADYCQQMLDPLILADVEASDGCRIPAVVSFRPRTDPSVRIIVQVNGQVDLIGRCAQIASPVLLHKLHEDLNQFHLF